MELLNRSLEHAPALAAMVVIVVAFLKFTKALLASHATRTDEFISTVKQINQDNKDDRREHRDTLRDNTRATENMTRAIETFGKTLPCAAFKPREPG
jgi:hypothetical protein